MISDQETNFVYLSDQMEQKCPRTFSQLAFWFKKLDIDYDILLNTKDLWVRDFMPIQYDANKFMQYKYDPQYLKTIKGQKTISDVKAICESLNIATAKSSIVLDGGNVVKSKHKAIISSRVFKDNHGYPRQSLINEIKNQLQVNQVILIPEEPGDFTGHSDGVIRFIDENTALLNEYPYDKKYLVYFESIYAALRNAGLDICPIPYTSWKNKSSNDATGCYINFLEIGRYIFCPAYGQPEDQWAMIQLKEVFRDREIIDIQCAQLAKYGGVLNCATWNILK